MLVPPWEIILVGSLGVLLGAVMAPWVRELHVRWKHQPALNPNEEGARELERLVDLLGRIQAWLSSTKQNDMIRKIRLNLCRLEWNVWLEACSYVALHSTNEERRRLALRNLSQVEDNESAQRAATVVCGLLKDPETPPSVARVAEAVLQELRIVMDAGDITINIEDIGECRGVACINTPGDSSDSGEHAKRYDAFLCHASEDKEAIVRPFTKAMQAVGLTPWVDESVIQWGHNLPKGIQEGISQSRAFVVFFSQSFLSRKRWTDVELSAALSGEVHGKIIVLPLLCGVNHKVLEREYPFLAAKHYESIPDYQTGKQVDSKVVEDLVRQLKGMILATWPNVKA